ncbi:DENN domain-containing protein 2A-like isoform X2 [Physeter macrocephalus]|uniref:DENN domain-containing protein 2A-like isoform X2 n=1 Tax=Physeter macrocephalus TaxID=9755 RepID=A0A9W2WI67_PHYMC|nr:DENN domain-containing protein 2A-like isoform X2 [Physeter catodon]
MRKEAFVVWGCLGREGEWELECGQLSLASPWRLPTSPKSALSPLSPRCSTLSKCCHAMVAVIYPFTWQHTYIPVLPPAMIDIVCSPTPFLIGLLTSSLPLLRELPLEEVLVVDLVNNRFLRQMDDEDSILPRKLQVALEHILEQRSELASDQGDRSPDCKRGKCSPTSQTAPPPSSESGSRWAMSVRAARHWVKQENRRERLQGERLGAPPLSQDLILTVSCGAGFSHPILALKYLFKGGEEMTRSLWVIFFVGHCSLPSRELASLSS